MTGIDNTNTLQFVRDAQAELSFALRSINGRNFVGPAFYCVISSDYINKSVEGYIRLREVPMVLASELLIRPLLEATFFLAAIQDNPSELFKKAHSEYVEDVKWANAYDPKDTDGAKALITNKWADFKKNYQVIHPTLKFSEGNGKYSAFEAAASTKSEKLYNTYYRLYCRHTHANLRVLNGSLQLFSEHDNGAVAICCMTALRFLKSVGGATTHFDSLSKRMKTLGKPETKPEQT